MKKKARVFLIGQGVRSQLKVINFWCGTFASFHMEGRATTVSAPQASAFPASRGVVDAAVQPFGVKTEWVRHGQSYPFTFVECQQSAALIACVDWCVGTQTEGVELIPPR